MSRPKIQGQERKVMIMTSQEIKENAKKYVLQSWSKQGQLNPIPVEKAEGIGKEQQKVTEFIRMVRNGK